MNGRTTESTGNGKIEPAVAVEGDTGKFPASSGNGWDDPFGISDGARGRPVNVPTVDQAQADPNSLLSEPSVRGLLQLHDTDKAAYAKLVTDLVAAVGKHPLISAKKLDDEVKALARKDRQEAKAANAAEADADNEPAADKIIRLIMKDAELFPAQDGQAYVKLASQPRALRIQGGTFQDVMITRYVDETGHPPPNDALKTAALTLAALAKRAPKRAVYARVAKQNGIIYVDRGLSSSDAYKISPAEKQKDGTYRAKWEQIVDPPSHFIQPEGTSIGELPIAKTAAERQRARDGGIEGLSQYLAVPDWNTFVLTVGGAVGGYEIEGDQVIVATIGEPNSGKTTVNRTLLALVDPLPLPLDAEDGVGDRRGHMSSPPRNAWDCALTAQATRVQSFDNLSEIPEWLEDVFCRFSTGGSIRRRNFYGLLDEVALSARRPVYFSAVEDLVIRDDLATRCLFIRAGRAPGVKMANEVRLWQQFEARWPVFLGCIFDAISVGLANQVPELPDPPRLSHFVEWIRRCEPGLGWPPGTFMAAYLANQVEGAEVVADADPVITAVREFAAKQADAGETGWGEGTPTDLYRELKVLVGESDQRSPKWPKRAAELSKKLRSSKGLLAKLGITLTIGQRSNIAAKLTLSWSLPPPPPASADTTVDAAAPEAGSRPQAEGALTPAGRDVGECKPVEPRLHPLSHGKISPSVSSVSSVSDSLPLNKKGGGEGDKAGNRPTTGAGPAAGPGGTREYRI